jgi:hypothetical protein
VLLFKSVAVCALQRESCVCNGGKSNSQFDSGAAKTGCVVFILCIILMLVCIILMLDECGMLLWQFLVSLLGLFC